MNHSVTKNKCVPFKIGYDLCNLLIQEGNGYCAWHEVNDSQRVQNLTQILMNFIKENDVKEEISVTCKSCVIKFKKLQEAYKIL